MSDQVKFLGTTDDVTTCDCCGRRGLKSTVVLNFSFKGSDAVVYYGIDCAARALGRSAKEIRKGTRAADDTKAKAEAVARAKAHAAYMAAWTTFLAVCAPGGHDVFTRIEALGGMKAARAAFEASPYATKVST